MNIKAATALLLTPAPAIILRAQRIRRHRLDLGPGVGTQRRLNVASMT
jgi:hypothetical protein